MTATRGSEFTSFFSSSNSRRVHGDHIGWDAKATRDIPSLDGIEDIFGGAIGHYHEQVVIAVRPGAPFGAASDQADGLRVHPVDHAIDQPLQRCII